MLKYCLLILLISIINCFQVVCPAFNSNEQIPIKFTPYGDDVNPQIQIIGELPANTKSLALAVNDPDAPNGLWSHWLVKNISPSTNNIPENSVPGQQVTNSWGITAYKGPKPPSGTHHYYFIIYALSIENFDASNPKEFYDQVGKNQLGQASYMGIFLSKNSGL